MKTRSAKSRVPLVVASALLALLTAEEWSRLLAPVVVAAIACSARALGFELGERLWTVAAVAALAWFGIATLVQGGSFLFAAVGLLLFLLVNKVHHLQRPRDFEQLLLVSLLLVLSSCILAVRLPLAMAILGFALSSQRLLASVYVQREREGSFVVPGGVRAVGMSSRALLVGAVFGIGIFFVFPRVGAGTLETRLGRPQHVSGFTAEVALDDIGGIKENDTMVARVRALSERAHDLELLRMVAFTDFDGLRWKRPQGGQVLENVGGRSSYPLALPGKEDPVWYELTVEPLNPELLPLPVRPVELRSSIRGLYRDRSGAVGLSDWSPDRRQRHTYEVAAIADPRSAEDLAVGVDNAELTAFVRLPDSISPEVFELARRWVPDGMPRAAAARAVLDALRRDYRYRLELEPAADPVRHFLFESRAGHCELFASAMVVLLRSREIPARVVNGFRVSEWNSFGGYWIVRQADAHAWVEVHFPRAGWVSYDPTPPDPARSRWPFGLRGLSHLADLVRFPWDRYVISWSSLDQTELLTSLGSALRSLGAWPGANPLGAGLALAAGVALALLRRGLRRRHPGVPKVVVIYEKLRRRLGHGRVGEESVGPLSLLRQYGDVAAVREIIEPYVRERFAGQPADRETIASMRRALRKLPRVPGA